MISSIRSTSLFISFLCALSVFSTSVLADKKPLTPMQKGYEQCLLDGGKTSIPANGKGATCCFPKSTSCITCAGGYCSAGKQVSILKEKHQNSAVGTTGVASPEKATAKDKLKSQLQDQVDAPAQVEQVPASKPIKGSVKEGTEHTVNSRTE